MSSFWPNSPLPETPSGRGGRRARYGALKAALSGTGIEVAAGPEALIEAASRPAQWVMSAIVGAAGLSPTLAAIRRGGWWRWPTRNAWFGRRCHDGRDRAQRCRAAAVDSEHSAIFQVSNSTRPSASSGSS